MIQVSAIRLIQANAEYLLPPEYETFTKSCIESPADAAPKGVFADWLQEQEETALAYAFRWLAKRGKQPGLANLVGTKKTGYTLLYFRNDEDYSHHVRADGPGVLPWYIDGECTGKTYLACVAILAEKLARLHIELDVTVPIAVSSRVEPEQTKE